MMLKRLGEIILSGIFLYGLSFFIFINGIKLMVFKDISGPSFDMNYIFNREGALGVSIFIPSLVWFWIILRVFKLNFKRKDKSKDDSINFSKLASPYEAKKGLIRLDFDGNHLKQDSAYSKVAMIINPIKKGINNVMKLFKVADIHRLNTIKTWEIDHKKVHVRAGLPIYTPLIFKKHCYVDPSDTHTQIIGTSGSGKTFTLICQLIDIIRMCGESLLVTDPKGELYDYSAKSMIEDGYEVIKLDFINPKQSDGWNPLHSAWVSYKEAYDLYLKEMEEWEEKKTGLSGDELREHLLHKPDLNVSEANEQLMSMASIICFDENSKDPFWKNKAADLISGFSSLLLEEGKPEYINFKTIRMLAQLGFEEISRGTQTQWGCKEKNYIQYFLKHYRRPDHYSTMQLMDMANGAESTTKGILSTFYEKIRVLTANEDIMRMTSKNTFNLEDLGKKKMAIFLIIHDEKKVYHPLATLFIKQLYEAMIRVTREQRQSSMSERLPVPVNLVLDEFGNMPPLQDIDSVLTAARSRGMRLYMVLQDDQQLITKYGKNQAATIKSQCTNTVYLMSNEMNTLTNFSKMCGSNQVWIPSKKAYENRPLISTDRLQRLNMGQVVIHRQRRNPFLTRMLAYDKCVFYRGKRPVDKIYPVYEKVNYMDIIKEIERLRKLSNNDEEVLISEPNFGAVKESRRNRK